MGKIYAPPEGFEPPDLTIQDIDKYLKECEKYEENLVKAIRTAYKGVCREAGEVISFPVCDGKARYIVATLKPVKLIHIDTGDAYQAPYVHRLTAKDLREEIRRTKALRDLFSKKKKEVMHV
jgi:hypothetical protein